jgi:glycosyltransferase involved in cell wall biosynthesis
MDLTRVGKRCLPRWAVATLRASDALVLLAPSQGEYLHREEQVGRRPWSSTREVVIWNGVTTRPIPDEAEKVVARAQLGLKPADFVVGIVARLSEQKAHEVLLEAFTELHRSLPQARLVIVGGGARETALRMRVEQLGLQGAVLFTGVRRDVNALLPAFDVSCLSSVHEGVPIAIIESMAAALPVVVTDCGALRDIVVDGQQGFIVPVADSSALAGRLLLLAGDAALRRRLGESGHDRVEREFRIEQTAAAYQDLLVNLVDAHAH